MSSNWESDKTEGVDPEVIGQVIPDIAPIPDPPEEKTDLQESEGETSGGVLIASGTEVFQRISLDVEDSDIVRLSKEGESLFFVSTVGEFKLLSQKTLKSLTPDNRQRYFLAKGEYEYNKTEVDMPDLGDLKVSARFMKASKRLEADPLPGMKPYWFRTDEVADQSREGWKVRTRPSEDGTLSSTVKVNARGEDEMVLMDLPNDEWTERNTARRALQKRRSEGHANQAERDIASVNRSSVYDPTKDGRSRFSAPVDSQGRPIKNG